MQRPRADAEAMAATLGGHVGALVDANSSGGPPFQQPPMLNLDARFGSQYAAPEAIIVTSATPRFRLVR